MNEWGITPTTSADGLTLIFASNRTSSGWNYDLWMSTRKDAGDDWGPPIRLGPKVNSGSYDGAGNLSADGLVLFFTSSRSGGFGSDDIWVTTRKTVNDPWQSPVNVGAPINTSATDAAPEISTDGRTLFFDSPRPGGLGHFDLWQVPIAPVFLLPDFDGDSVINFTDFCTLAQHWFQTEASVDISPPPNGDGRIDFEDLSGFVEYWLHETRLVVR
jgi:hypothetical protein